MKIILKNKFYLGVAIASLSVTSHASPIEEYYFESDVTYSVRTALGVVTQIELSPRENVKDYSTGLSSGWDLARRDNVFYLKPKQEAVDTNLIVRTQAHQYIFELKVIPGNWKTLADIKNRGVHYQVKFRYPEHTDFNIQNTTQSGLNTQYNPNKSYYTNYDVAADDASVWLIPLKTYDDGDFTYIHLNKSKFSGGFPTVYARKTINGQEFVLNTTIENNIIAIHGTYPILVLRHGNNVVGLRRN